ncbi:hypothetical protein [Streptomyces sp. NPDC086023]|uniref:hypothetical protein n=1 Tax=Streptomyces sp. NPDC086023 TaxID=3365746 RepID=UPI0037D87314
MRRRVWVWALVVWGVLVAAGGVATLYLGGADGGAAPQRAWERSATPSAPPTLDPGACAPHGADPLRSRVICAEARE